MSKRRKKHAEIIKHCCNSQHKTKILDSKGFKYRQVKHFGQKVRSVFSTIHPLNLLHALDKSLHFSHLSFPSWCPDSFSKMHCFGHSLFFLPRVVPESVSLSSTPWAPGLPHSGPTLLPPEAQRSCVTDSDRGNRSLTTFTVAPGPTLWGWEMEVHSYQCSFRGLKFVPAGMGRVVLSFSFLLLLF